MILAADGHDLRHQRDLQEFIPALVAHLDHLGPHASPSDCQHHADQAQITLTTPAAITDIRDTLAATPTPPWQPDDADGPYHLRLWLPQPHTHAAAHHICAIAADHPVIVYDDDTDTLLIPPAKNDDE